MTIYSGASVAESIRVYAASSMTNAVNEISQLYREQTGNRVIPVFGGSSSLARQIENGAPADVYISANQKWVDYLAEQEHVPLHGTKVIARNSLVVVSREQISDFDITNSNAWSELLVDNRLAVGQVSSVPAGIYAKQALQKLEVWEPIRARLAQVNNVRLALALVDRGEARIGIVYSTDAFISDNVSVVGRFPLQSHDPIVYPAVLVSSQDSSADFYRFLSTETAKSVFSKYGFQ